MTKAKVVRQTLAQLLNTNAREVHLMPEPISPAFTPQNDCGHSWWDGAEWHKDEVFGFSFSNGLTVFDDIKRDYRYSENGTVYSEKGEQLGEYFERKQIGPDSFEFIVVKYRGKEYGEGGETYSGVSLYRAPDFKSHWEKVEAQDIERWEKWLNR